MSKINLLVSQALADGEKHSEEMTYQGGARANGSLRVSVLVSQALADGDAYSDATRYQEGHGYLNDARLESFGHLLADYVINGADITIDGKAVRVDEGIISFNDQLWRAFASSFYATEPNTTYYIGFAVEQGYIFGPTEPSEKYLRLWEIPTDEDGELGIAFDSRGKLGRVKFKAIYDGVYFNTEEVQTAIDNAIAATATVSGVVNEAQYALADVAASRIIVNNLTVDANLVLNKANSAFVRAEEATGLAENAILDANEANNTANVTITNANKAVTDANKATTDANKAATDANSAATAANIATTNANHAAISATNAATSVDIARNNAIDATNAANTATANANLAGDNAIIATTSATDAAVAANAATINANTAAAEANAAKASTETAVNAANTLVNNTRFVNLYATGTVYAKNNIVSYNGSSFIALQATTGNAPPLLPTTQNAWWALLAQRGVDGQGSVASVNGLMPDINGNVNLGPIETPTGSQMKADKALNDAKGYTDEEMRNNPGVIATEEPPIDQRVGSIWFELSPGGTPGGAGGFRNVVVGEEPPEDTSKVWLQI